MVWLSTLGQTHDPGLAQGKISGGSTFLEQWSTPPETVPKYGWGGVGFE